MKRAVGAMVVVVLAAAPTMAQQQASQSTLPELAAGTPVIVTTVPGILVKGELKMMADDGIVVVAKTGERQIPLGDLQAVRVTKRDSVWNGIVAGAALGFGGGAGLGATWFYGSGRYGAKPRGYGREFISGTAALGSVVGALVGWRLDAARIRSDVVYEAPSVR